MTTSRGHGHGHISQDIRRRLLDAGIPADDHGFEALARYFPREFKIKDSHLEPETIAAVLLHLVKAGLIKLPKKQVQR